MKRIFMLVGAFLLVLTACAPAEPDQTYVKQSKARIVKVVTEEGTVLKCVILTNGEAGSRSQTMGMDCQWPGEA